ncbi:hypothetical protein V1264_003506 [Littorina saxatilis]
MRWYKVAPWFVGFALICILLRPLYAFKDMSTFSFYWGIMLVFAFFPAQLVVQFALLYLSLRRHVKKLRVTWKSYVARFSHGSHAQCKTILKRSRLLVKVLIVFSLFFFSSMVYCTCSFPNWKRYLAPLDALPNDWFLVLLMLHTAFLTVGINTEIPVVLLYVILARVIRHEFLLVTQELEKVLPQTDSKFGETLASQNVSENTGSSVESFEGRNSNDVKQSPELTESCNLHVTNSLLHTSNGVSELTGNTNGRTEIQTTGRGAHTDHLINIPKTTFKNKNQNREAERYPKQSDFQETLNSHSLTVIDLETTEAVEDVVTECGIRNRRNSDNAPGHHDISHCGKNPNPSFKNSPVFTSRNQMSKPLPVTSKERCPGDSTIGMKRSANPSSDVVKERHKGSSTMRKSNLKPATRSHFIFQSPASEGDSEGERSQLSSSEKEFCHLRNQHESLCRLLSLSQRCFQHFIACNFAVSVPLLCFMIYSLASGAGRVNQWGFMFTMCMERISLLGVVIAFAISLQEAARSPLSMIYASDWSALSHPLVTKLQLFTTRLHDSDLGYHVYGLFSVTRETVLMLAGTFITYAVVVIQFQMGSPVTSYCSANATREGVK